MRFTPEPHTRTLRPQVVFLEPSFGGFQIGEHLDVVNVADFLRCVNVNEHGHWSLASLRRPQ
jgi:hypothetical protein